MPSSLQQIDFHRHISLCKDHSIIGIRLCLLLMKSLMHVEVRLLRRLLGASLSQLNFGVYSIADPIFSNDQIKSSWSSNSC